MQACSRESSRGPKALSWTQLPTPEPGPVEVRIAIKAASQTSSIC